MEFELLKQLNETASHEDIKELTHQLRLELEDPTTTHGDMMDLIMTILDNDPKLSGLSDENKQQIALLVRAEYKKHKS